MAFPTPPPPLRGPPPPQAGEELGVTDPLRFLPHANGGDHEVVEGALSQPIRTPMAPSTGRIAPEMNFDSSEARNKAA